VDNHLGHPNFPYLKFLYLHFFINKNQTFPCEQCTIAKQSRSSHPIQSYKPSKPFHLVHSDIWGPSKTPNISGSKWFLTFIHDHSRACWVYLMTGKSEACNIFKKFHKLILNMFQTSIQILRTDNGREYFSHDLTNYLFEHGILHQSSCDTPQQNGVAERKNRHLLEMA